MTVVFGFPSISIKRILGEIDSTVKRLFKAFGDNKKPMPPTEALAEFFHEEDVTSWYESAL